MYEALPSHVNEGTVDGMRALLNLQAQQFASILEHCKILRTPFGIVAALDPRSGIPLQINWQRISENSSVELKLRA